MVRNYFLERSLFVLLTWPDLTFEIISDTQNCAANLWYSYRTKLRLFTARIMFALWSRLMDGWSMLYLKTSIPCVARVNSRGAKSLAGFMAKASPYPSPATISISRAPRAKGMTPFSGFQFLSSMIANTPIVKNAVVKISWNKAPPTERWSPGNVEKTPAVAFGP